MEYNYETDIHQQYILFQFMASVTILFRFKFNLITCDVVNFTRPWKRYFGQLTGMTIFNHVTRKMQSGAHLPQDFIFSISDIWDTKFMLYNIVGHYLR